MHHRENGSLVIGECLAEILRSSPDLSPLEDLPGRIVAALAKRKASLSLAESCTGGWLAKMITDVPGASDVFRESLVTYANEAKIDRLGVSSETLMKYGAVSAECVREMAEGLKQDSGSTLTLAVSGIAGPGGGSEQKPVGCVYFALAAESATEIRRFDFSGNRDEVRLCAVYQALRMIKYHLEGKVF